MVISKGLYIHKVPRSISVRRYFIFNDTVSIDIIYSVNRGMINEYVAVRGMRNDRRNISIRGKPAPMTLCAPQIPSYPGRRFGKPATNRLSYGTAPLEANCSLLIELLLVFLSLSK
jgi:hypothetical protein